MIEDCVLAIAGANNVDIVARAALKDVVAFAAVQGIVVRATAQRVDAVAADQLVVTGIASERIVFSTAFQIIVSVASSERIFSLAAVQMISVASALKRIAPVAGKTDADGINLLQYIAARYPDAVVLALGVLERLVGKEVTFDAVVLASDNDIIGNVVDVFLVLPGQELGAVLYVGIAKVPPPRRQICRRQGLVHLPLVVKFAMCRAENVARTDCRKRA